MMILTSPSPQQRQWFRFSLLLVIGAFSYLLFGEPSYPQPFSHTDKLGHLAGFATLALLLHLAFDWPKSWQFAVLALYAGLVELVQSYLPYRQADPMDWLADMAGVLMFHLFLAAVRRWQRP
ncbi:MULTISPECIES: VanZ family protein [Ferrimonas]|uniref:VanZ family protein n=1 Tax=Ferrimonas TaxID=44011 RepID=UPI000429F0CD|nr:MULTISPECIES: VanZ family protein [Ferrimonas]